MKVLQTASRPFFVRVSLPWLVGSYLVISAIVFLFGYHHHEHRFRLYGWDGARSPVTLGMNNLADPAVTTTTTTTTATTHDDSYHPDPSKPLTGDTGARSEHLLVDIRNAHRIRQPDHLVQILRNLAHAVEMDEIKTHCHENMCLMLGQDQSMMVLHVWPEDNVALLDLLVTRPATATNASSNTVPVILLPLIQREMEVAAQDIRWSLKPRGVHRPSASILERNQHLWGWSEFDLKDLVVDAITEYQHVQVYHVIHSRFRTWESYQNSLGGNQDHTSDDQVITSYEAQNPRLFQPDRMVYYDGVLQSRLFGDAAYYETLVHPAMFAHVEPERVAIIGGAEGGTLREVLKHNTVERVTMIELDRQLIDICRAHLPEWSNCTSFGTTPSCFDDPRVEMYHGDAVTWFIEHFGDEDDVKEDDKYDVIIMDAVDSTMAESVIKRFHENMAFAEALVHSLTDDGILVTHVGPESANGSGVRGTAEESVNKFLSNLEWLELEAAKDYLEAHGGFTKPKRFLVAFKNRYSLSSWYMNEAEMKTAIRYRITSNHDGTNPLRYFDGATMMTYQHPSRTRENIYCSEGKCNDFHGLDPEIDNVRIDQLEVRSSPIPNAGRGLFFKVDAPKGTYVGADALAECILYPPSTYWYANTMRRYNLHYFQTMSAYTFGYGYANEAFGDVGYSVEPSILTFTNHGCNGTYNQGLPMPVTEMNASLTEMPTILDESYAETYFYDPFTDRSLMLHMHVNEHTLRDLKAGDELLDNYLSYLSVDNWSQGLADYRAQCALQGVGEITRYQSSATKDEL